MKKRYLVLAALLIAALAAAGWLFLRPAARTPHGQTPLVFLTAENFLQVRATFNEAPDSVRIVLLLSPT